MKDIFHLQRLLANSILKKSEIPYIYHKTFYSGNTSCVGPVSLWDRARDWFDSSLLTNWKRRNKLTSEKSIRTYQREQRASALWDRARDWFDIGLSTNWKRSNKLTSEK